VKKLILVSSILGSLAGIGLAGWALRPIAPAELPASSAAVVAPAGPQSPDADAARRFVDFPIGQPRVVDFSADAAALEQLTSREQRDQFRDWLLFAVVSAAGLPPEQLNQSLYDIPALRHGYMRAVANFEYGETRSCSIGEGQVLALIPSGEGPRRGALLAEIADAHRKNLGAEPRTISVVEYELDSEGQSARLTRREDLDAHRFFTAEAGYHQVTVRSLNDLVQFAATVDDITFAAIEGGSVVLGGRKVADHAYRGVRVQDVAAIWQAEEKLHRALGEFEAWIKNKEDEFNAQTQAELATLNARWEGKLARINQRLRSGLARLRSPYDVSPPRAPGLPANIPEAAQAQSPFDFPPPRSIVGRPPGQADDEFENAPIVDEDAIRLRQEEEFARLKAARQDKWKLIEREVAEERDRRKLVKGSGFSLDPDYDFEGLAAFVQRLVLEFEEFAQGKGPSAIPVPEWATIRQALGRNDPAPFHALLDRLEAGEGSLTGMLHSAYRSAQLAARSRNDKADVGELSRLLARLETELDGLAAGRWPDGSAADFGPVRKGLERGDEAPLRGWLDRMKVQEGPLARAIWSLVAVADDRYHSRSVTDRAGLDAWLARLQAEVEQLAAGSVSSTPLAELRRAAEALRLGDDSPYRKLVARWKKTDDFLAGSLGELLAWSWSGDTSRQRLDHEGLQHLFVRVDKGLRSLVGGDHAPLSSRSIREVRAALARGDDAALQKLADGLRNARRWVDNWIGASLARATTRFRACDREGLAAYFSDLGSWARKPVAGDTRMPAASDLRKLREGVGKIRERLARQPAGAPAPRPGVPHDRHAPGSEQMEALTVDFLTNGLAGSGNPIGSALAAELNVAAAWEEDRKQLAYAVDAIGKELGELPALLPIGELRAAARALSSASKGSQGRGKQAEQAVVPLLTCTDQLAKSRNTLARRLAHHLDAEFRTFSFQMARYDGDLKGTEVGMVLFYTDLLAKLWAIDYMHNHPARAIEDFHAMPDLTISPVFAEEIRKLPNTRLWFGHEDKGFQVAGDGDTLILARNATRIYAASSNPLTPGEEVPAAANSEAFLGWWNDHYGDVARFEPEYERLNEIMKWSLLISWLNEKGQDQALGFLAGVAVDHSRWFPDWVRARPDLRFHRWDAITFHQPGYKGSTTEALPMLDSEEYEQFGEVHTLSGGVSLAPKALFRNRPVLAPKVNPLIRRSNLNYAARWATEEGLSFKTLQESQYTFRPLSSGRSALEILPREGTRLRGRVAEITTPKFERTVSSTMGRWEISARLGDRDLAMLRVRPTQNGLAVGLKSRELATGQALAHRASLTRGAPEVLARHADVEAAVHTDQAVFVRLRGSDSWLKLAAEPSGPDVPSGAASVARVADPRPGAQPYDVLFVDASAPKAALTAGESIAIEVPESSGSGLAIRVLARGPPPEVPLTTVEIEWNGGTLRGRFDPESRALFLDRDRLPAELLDQPGLIQGVLRNSGLGRLQSSPIQAGPVRLTARGAVSAESRLLRQIEEGRFRPVAQELAADPNGFAGRLKSEYGNRLRQCDELLRDGQSERALRALDTLEELFGTRPEIQLRQAVGEIRAGHTARGARLANRAMETPQADLAKLYEEINIRLEEPTLDPRTRADLTRLRDAVTWRDLKIAGKGPTGDVVLAANGEHLGLELHAAHELPPGEPVPVERALSSDAPVYIQDSPGLNNLDWAPSFRETLLRLIEGKLAKVVSVADVGIAEFQPSKIFAGKSSASTAAKAAGYTKVHPSASLEGSPLPPSGLSLPGHATGDEDAEKKRKQRLAAWRAGRDGAADQVFVILPAVGR
jgi:hypothetical protein